MAANRKGESWAVLAMSEMGKGVWLKQRLNETCPEKLIIWDTNDEYDKQASQVRTFTELLQAMRQQVYAVRYVPKAKTNKVYGHNWRGYASTSKAATDRAVEDARRHWPGFSFCIRSVTQVE